MARALEVVAARSIWAVATQYVDDYPQVVPEELANGGPDLDDLLALLGWEVKKVKGNEADGGGEEAETIPRYGKSFSPLGVVVKLPSTGTNKMEVADKPERVDKLKSFVTGLKLGAVLRPGAVSSFRGAVGYSRSQAFGRCGAAELHYLGELSRRPPQRIDAQILMHLSFWGEYFGNCKPRTVLLGTQPPPVDIYGDGSEEPGGVGIGGVLRFRGRGARREFFASKVEEGRVRRWKEEAGGEKVIHQAEIYSVVVALRTWGPALRGRRLLVFVDNDAARAALVAGGSRALPSAKLVGEFWQLAAEYHLYPWVERVPTRSNPADAPSRGDRGQLKGKGFEEVVAVVASWRE